MASLIEELITVLEEEDKVYQMLMTLSKEKTPVIVKGNLEKLKEITAVEQALVDKLVRLEKRRTDVVGDMALVLNQKEEDLTVRNIVNILKGQEEEKKRLSLVHDSLKQTLEGIQRLNEMNMNLINSSLEMVEFNINMVKGLYQAPEMGNYGRDAYNTESIMGYGVFDAKN